MNLFLELVESPWFWADVILSVSGGLLVWWGLKIEKRAEDLIPPDTFKPDLFGDIVTRQKNEIERGWRILMAGIVFEVIAALGISVISGLEIAELKDKASQANKDAGEAKRVAANTESNNLVLRSNIVAMELKIRPRSLDASTRSNLLACLKSGPNGDVAVVAPFPDNEAREYGDQLSAILQAAGFRAVGLPNTSIILSLDPPGVAVTCRDGTENPKHASAIMKCFDENGLKPTFTHPGALDCPTGVVAVLIGPRF